MAKRPGQKITMTSIDELLCVPDTEGTIDIDVEAIYPFENHPFKDYQTNYKLAQEYFEEVSAPYKQMFIMENMTHGLLESDSEGFSQMLHQIAEIERAR